MSNIFTPWKNPAPKTTPDSPTATPPPSATAAVGATDQAALNAEQNFTQQAMRQKSFSKTIFAGDTGGFVPGRTAGRPGL